MGDVTLEEVTEKVLDVIIDEKLKFDKYTEAKVNKAKKVRASSKDNFKLWTGKPLCGFSKH